tara:strand:+ start:4385 stop:4810 length:426 start_codon:yes stop_codon:yes gene_type:complete
MSDYNTLEQKLEGAAKDVLDDASAWTITAYTGEDDEDIGTPRVVCMVESAEEEQLGTGNWRVSLTVRLTSNADDSTASAHAANVEKMRDLFLDDDIAATLSGNDAEFHVLGLYSRTTAKGIEERNRFADVTLELLAAPSNL